MPILAAEPDLYPPDLWEVGPPPPDPEVEAVPRWWCLHTKPRQEKATARHLLQGRIPYYLPQAVQEGHTPAGRKTRSVIPLFHSYVFMYGTDVDRIESYRAESLVRVLDVVDQDGLVRDLRGIHRLLASGLVVAPERTYPVGTRVRILQGPLAGMVGIVLRRGKRDQFVATVRFLGSGAAVDLQDWQVEPADEA